MDSQEEIERLLDDDLLALVDAGNLNNEALIQATAIEVATCAICGRTIQARDRPVRTTTGEFVHIACAAQLAASAYTRRRQWALVHGVAFVGVVIAAERIAGMTSWLIVFVAVGFVLHGAMHRRWWYYLQRDLGIWLRHSRR